MEIKCIIIDDEPLAIELIESHLLNFDFIKVVATASNAIKALELIKQYKVDLIFCDIKMPVLNGIDLIKSLKSSSKVIITTAYRDFAVEGYTLDIIDYLLKPITFERFFLAIEKVYKLLYIENDSLQTINTMKNESITIKADNVYHKIKYSDIFYIESQKDYVKFFTDGNTIITKNKISELEILLKSEGFLRIHRSYLVNIKNIKSFTAITINLANTELPIGLAYRENALALLKQ